MVARGIMVLFAELFGPSLRQFALLREGEGVGCLSHCSSFLQPVRVPEFSLDHVKFVLSVAQLLDQSLNSGNFV